MESDSSDGIEVTVAAPAWHATVTDPEGTARRAATAVLERLAVPDRERLELGIRLADDAEVRELNRTWRGQDKPTNVLSFPAHAPDRDAAAGEAETGDGDDRPAEGRPEAAPVLLGDVVLALETVAREAAESGKRPEDHLTHLVVHGTLHLLGYDHEVAAEAAEMEALETRILAGLGIADPYAAEAPGPHASGSAKSGVLV